MLQVCIPHTECDSNQVELVAPTNTSDRVCSVSGTCSAQPELDLVLLLDGSGSITNEGFAQQLEMAAALTRILLGGQCVLMHQRNCDWSIYVC